LLSKIEAMPLTWVCYFTCCKVLQLPLHCFYMYIKNLKKMKWKTHENRARFSEVPGRMSTLISILYW
jgi:hypothetical protein